MKVKGYYDIYLIRYDDKSLRSKEIYKEEELEVLFKRFNKVFIDEGDIIFKKDIKPFNIENDYDFLYIETVYIINTPSNELIEIINNYYNISKQQGIEL